MTYYIEGLVILFPVNIPFYTSGLRRSMNTENNFVIILFQITKVFKSQKVKPHYKLSGFKNIHNSLCVRSCYTRMLYLKQSSSRILSDLLARTAFKRITWKLNRFVWSSVSFIQWVIEKAWKTILMDLIELFKEFGWTVKTIGKQFGEFQWICVTSLCFFFCVSINRTILWCEWKWIRKLWFL